MAKIFIFFPQYLFAFNQTIIHAMYELIGVVSIWIHLIYMFSFFKGVQKAIFMSPLDNLPRVSIIYNRITKLGKNPADTIARFWSKRNSAVLVTVSAEFQASKASVWQQNNYYGNHYKASLTSNMQIGTIL